MALHFPINVNDEIIGHVNIQRHGPVIRELPNVYDVMVTHPLHTRTRRVRVVHFYDDGALVLIRDALSAIIDPQRGLGVPDG